MKKFVLVYFLMVFANCSSQHQLFENLAVDNDLLQEVFSYPEKFEVQILYSQIDRKENGKAFFRDFSYRLDQEAYFYPASTVKLPVAILALEKLRDLRNQNPHLSRNTPYILEGDSIAYSISGDVEAIFAVSDNEAFNRLFEFLGQDHINGELRQKGLTPVQITHRLSTANSEATKTRSMKFRISKNSTSLDLELPGTKNQLLDPLKIRMLEKGKGYMQNDSLINLPFDFSAKNYLPLEVQHQLMKQLMFPENYRKEQRFELAEDDREFLLQAMSRLPREAGYDPVKYQDSYSKFFMFGDSKDPMSGEVKIFNKVGYAYGTLTETAYILDESRNIEFILSATLLVNKNGIFNDNKYEYESIGIPFLAALGRELYQLELNRKK